MPTVHLIVGASCSGKSSFVKNVFLNGKEQRAYRDIIPVVETDDAVILGIYDDKGRRVGTDRTNRKDISLYFDQIEKAYNSGKDVVAEGTRLVNRTIAEKIRNAGMNCKLYYLKCSVDTILRRNREINSPSTVSDLTGTCTAARNFYLDYYDKFDCVVLDSERCTDFTKFNLDYVIEKENKEQNYAVFIVSHGRADRVQTLRSLRECGYTGRVFIIIDDEDDEADEYYRLYGDNVVQFSKKEYDGKFDIMDLHTDRRVVVYARNACFDIAKQLGYRYFLVLDDDYSSFMHRFPVNQTLGFKKCDRLDELFEAMFDFLRTSGAHAVAFAQGGDFIGGIESRVYRQGLLRKCMNTWFCDAEKPFEFIGRINEDTNTYVYLGTQGKLFFTITNVMIVQKTTQQNAGGLTDIYLDLGTYVKSFYTVMVCPSCARISAMGAHDYRMHHEISWNKCTPKILSDRWKK